MSQNDNYILIIDYSTVSVKFHIFNTEGAIIFKKNLKHLQADELSKPDILWDNLCQRIKTTLQQTEITNIKGIGVTAQLGMVPVDIHGKAIGPILNWQDNRAQKQSEEINELIGENDIYNITGHRMSFESTAAKILWFKQEKKDIFNNTYKFLTLKDYIIYKLTGEYVIDSTHASYSLLYDIKKRKWSKEIIKALDIDINKLPDVYASHQIVGNIRKESSKITTIPSNALVSVGGPDGSIGTLGAGLIETGRAVNLIGTTDVFFTCCEKPILDQKMRTVVNCHIVPELYSIGGPMSFSGGCLQWVVDQFAKHEKLEAAKQDYSVYDLFNKKAAKIKPGSKGLLFFTSLVGERAPAWDPQFKGSIIGLTSEHKMAHLVRAVMEGSSFAVKQMIDIIEQELNIDINEVTMVGGGAKSNLWQQIRSDITGKSYLTTKINEATSFGAFLTVVIALGIFKDYKAAQEQLIEINNTTFPGEENYDKYQSIYRKYCSAYQLLKEFYHMY